MRSQQHSTPPLRAAILLLLTAAATADEAACDGSNVSLPPSYVHADHLGAADAVRPLLPQATIADLELPPGAPPGTARRIFEEFGVLLVRGLASAHASHINAAAEAAFARSLGLLEAGRFSSVTTEHAAGSQHHVGWVTPDQTLFIPAPAGHVRDKQAMVLSLDYYSDAAMLAAASDPRTLDIVQEILGSENIEYATCDRTAGAVRWAACSQRRTTRGPHSSLSLFLSLFHRLFSKGQCFYKEGVPAATSAGGVEVGSSAAPDAAVAKRERPGGNPKYLHQDSAYFMFAGGGAVATLSYACNTSGALDNGPLYVVPGSHRFGHLPHRDTPSHLGVDSSWSFDDALRIDGAQGDTIFFHIHTLHGSTPNRSPSPRATFINRYLEAADYQAFFATDARMRQERRAAYERGVAEGRLPTKERGLMVRGMREWREDGPAWLLNAAVNH